MNKKAKKAASPKGRILSVLKYILSFAAIGLLAVILAYVWKAEQLGFAAFPKETDISVSSPYYQQGLHCWVDGDYMQAEKNFLSALQEVQNSKDDKSLETAAVMQKLGLLYYRFQNEYSKSYEYLNKAYAVFKEELGAQDGTTNTTAYYMCICDLETGNVERALSVLLDTYHEKIARAQKIEFAQLLAQTYSEQEDYPQTSSFYQALDRLGVVNIDSVLSWYKYGDMLLKQNEPEEALSKLKTAEDYWKKLSDRERAAHLEVLSNIYGSFAIASAKLNRSEEAFSYCGQVLEINQSMKDGNAGAANAYLCIAYVYDLLERKEDSRNAIELALAVVQDSEGEYSSMTASVYQSLASLYYQEGFLDLAREYDEKANEIQKMILSDRGESAALTYLGLSMDYQAASDYEKSIEYGLKGLEVCESQFGRDDPFPVRVYQQLASVYLDSGDVENALLYAKQAVDVGDHQMPETDAIRAAAHQQLAMVYEARNQYPECFDQFQLAAELYGVSFGENAYPRAHVFQLLGNAYYAFGNYQGAKEPYQSALDIFLQLGDQYTVRVAGLYNSFGLAAFWTEDYGIALRQYEQAETFYSKAIQENETDRDIWYGLAVVYNNIAAVHEKRGQYEEAAEFELETYRILSENYFDYQEETLIAQRLERLHQKLAPDVPLEIWLKEGDRSQNESK